MKIVLTATIALALLLGAALFWFYVAVPATACVYGAVARSYNMNLSGLDELKEVQARMVHWCYSGELK